ncbi:rhomboid family intramembrane serine protease [Lachnoclostridium sp.]|uniref:rhomboid family intramembrane serine protease n=1 Tax=Lachnoclostridium sp. TaxID=2028282 RepID=UPI00289A5A49|nr:rhomboid family intramembrane serine protease [Lachnoclostridium sp.]
MKVLKRIDYNAPVVLSFALLSFIVLLLGEATGGTTTLKYFCVYRSSLADPLTYFRLFSHVLGHANLQHYASNMLLLLILGPMLEEKYGSKIILEMIVVTAFVTGVINFIFFTNGLLGASGIVFMMIVLSSMVSLKEGKIPLTLIIVVIIYLGQEISIGLTAKDNISHLTHILGGVCGGVMGAMVFNNKKLV